MKKTNRKTPGIHKNDTAVLLCSYGFYSIINRLSLHCFEVVKLEVNPFKPNGITHSYYLERSFLLEGFLLDLVLYVPSTIF